MPRAWTAQLAGERQGISPATAKTHVSRIMGKLGARDRALVVVAGYESGLAVPSHVTGSGLDP